MPKKNILENATFKELQNEHEITVQITATKIPQPIDNFTELNLNETLYSNIEESKYTSPTIVQKYSIPIVLNKCDLMSCAQTGSGKTAAFLIPIIHLLDQLDTSSHRNRREVTPSSIILAPTRELALQTLQEACKLSQRLSKLRSCVVFGGEEIRTQIYDLNRGCDILIATPGRLKDLCHRGKVSFRNVKFLVLDEADRMLDMGFEPQIRHLVQERDMPVVGERQTLMFSATFQKKVQILASEFLSNYTFLSVGRVGSVSSTINQQIEWVTEKDKHFFLLDILNMDSKSLKLIFVETKRNAQQLEFILNENNYPAISIHGDKPQSERERALYLFKKGIKPILIATSVAARGLDITNIHCVVNYDLPSDIDEYVHRIGRTGRAGVSGEAISFFNQKNIKLALGIYELMNEMGQRIPQFLEQIVNELSPKNKTHEIKSIVNSTDQSKSQVSNSDYRLKKKNLPLNEKPSVKVSNTVQFKEELKKDNECIDWFDQT